MSDYEVLDIPEENKPSDLSPVALGALQQIPFMFLFFIFLIYLLLSNDIYYNRILSKFNGAMSPMGMPTTYGTIITGIILVILVAIIDILIKKEII